MRNALAALMFLPLLASVAMAETSERATFAPATAKASAVADAVNRAKHKAVAFDAIALSEASVKDVDANGDGKVSFEELLRHDMKHDMKTDF